MVAQPSDFPHGPCECRQSCPFCSDTRAGPAAFEVTRHGKRIRVCTRCDLSTDENKTLLVTENDSPEPYVRWDALGVLCITGMFLMARRSN